MSFRISFGSHWLEVLFMYYLGLGGMIYLSVKCGHNSTRNIIDFRKVRPGAMFLKFGKRKGKVLRRA